MLAWCRISSYWFPPTPPSWDFAPSSASFETTWPLKENQTEVLSWPGHRKCASISTSRFIWLFDQYLFKTSTVLLQISIPQGSDMLVHSLPMKNRKIKRLGHDAVDTFITRSSLIYEITDKTACWAQSGNTHTYVFMAFKHQFLTKWMKNCVKNNCCVCILYFISVRRRAFDASSVRFPFNSCYGQDRF